MYLIFDCLELGGDILSERKFELGGDIRKFELGGDIRKFELGGDILSERKFKLGGDVLSERKFELGGDILSERKFKLGGDSVDIFFSPFIKVITQVRMLVHGYSVPLSLSESEDLLGLQQFVHDDQHKYEAAKNIRIIGRVCLHV